jgi:ketosteroid isomerase-like protein
MADKSGFESLLYRLADSWAGLDAEAAAACFTNDAVYMEPPDVQFFEGHDALTAYFSPLTKGTYLDFHGIWFDEDSQSGAVEFSFGVRGAETADHGVVVVGLRDGLISSWREYPRQGPVNFSSFVAPTGKTWTWHAGNYP